MTARLGMLVLLAQQCFCAIITDSFLHQGVKSDSLVFYSDTLMPVRIRMRRDNGGRDCARVFFSKTRATCPSVINRIAQRATKGYRLTCTRAGSDMVCQFVYPRGTMRVQVDQQKNWHGIPTTTLTCRRLGSVAKPVIQTPVIVIDCGHGGEQSGACGLAGTVEKQITLALGKQLHACLSARGYRVLLTRDSDRTVLLDERTSFANKHHACLLISLHNNHAPNQEARGIETLYSTDRSELLARFIHEQLVAMPIPGIVDRGVKHGMLQTLVGCECPAVLVELFFISNQQDARLLQDQSVRDTIVAGLCAAIDRFVALKRN